MDKVNSMAVPGKSGGSMAKTKRTTILCMTILLFVSMIAVVGIMCSYLLTYVPEGANVVKEGDTVTFLDEDGNVYVGSDGSGFVASSSSNYNFLVLGHDRAATLTDVIMLINFNVKDGSITVLQFPRDTYVGYGVATSKINATYATYLNQARGRGSDNPELDALRQFADVIEKALCTKISYCAIMNLNGFVNIVDILGGVELNVPSRMYYNDPDQNLYIDLQPGYQTLNGNQAEQFVRFRYGYLNGDIGRQDAQKIFMSAFMKKFQSSISVSKLSSMAETVLDNLYTDITISDFVYFGKALLGMDMSKMTMLTAPVNAAGNHVVISEPLLIDIVNDHFNLYDNDIVPEIFDVDKIFMDKYNGAHVNAYNSETAAYGGKEYDAGDVNDDSIDIPRGY